MDLHAEFTLSTVVEAMLPRFSDRTLGLLMGIQLDASDYGFSKSGNTRERKELSIRRYVWFLFNRPSNYTKVYLWFSPANAKGLDINPKYNPNVVWKLICDHDSCWKNAIGSALQSMYYPMMELFKGRKISGVEMNPYRDVSQFNLFHQDPQYVEMLSVDKVNPKADSYTEEGKDTIIKFVELKFHRLEQIQSPDNSYMCDSGLLIKGTEQYVRYLDAVKLYHERRMK